jgi:hypothetical protein
MYIFKNWKIEIKIEMEIEIEMEINTNYHLDRISIWD